jgi:hypothetical protein
MSHKPRNSGKPRQSPPRSPILFFAIFFLVVILALIIGFLWLLNSPKMGAF